MKNNLDKDEVAFLYSSNMRFKKERNRPPQLTNGSWDPRSEWEKDLYNSVIRKDSLQVDKLLGEFLVYKNSDKNSPEDDKIVGYTVYDDWSDVPVPPEVAEANPEGVKGITIPISALDIQEGGDHYKKQKIQPIEYIEANELDYMQGCVVKYITRHKDKNGIEDIRKIKHYCDLILELQYGQEDS